MIHFGTAGWRGVIGDEFTFHNVRLVSQAIANHLITVNGNAPAIVGYDTRFLSERFAAEAAKVLSQNGIRSLCCCRDVPTPTISFSILKWDACGALNFTASHNPPQYNGLKFHDASGATALPEVTARIEHELRALESSFNDSYAPAAALIETIDPADAYLDQLGNLVDLELISRSGLRLAVDSLYGTGREYLDRILIDAGVCCEVIHNFRDPYFGGYSPESRESNLRELQELVRSGTCTLGLATDSDCDRFAIIDTDGSYLNPNDVLGLLAHFILSERGTRGDLGRTVATTHLIDRVAALHGVRVHETPVGFKYIGKLIRDGRIVFGGEESAGLSIAGHVPDKDGILACLLVAELAARHGVPVRRQLEALWDKVGRSVHERRDYTLDAELEESTAEKLRNPPAQLAGLEVLEVTRLDGVKLHFEDSWFLYRRSGTENVLRCYAEAPTREQVLALHAAGRSLLSGQAR